MCYLGKALRPFFLPCVKRPPSQRALAQHATSAWLLTTQRALTTTSTQANERDVRGEINVCGSFASCSCGLRVDPRGRQQDRSVLAVVRPCSLRKLVQVPGVSYLRLATSASASEGACAAAASARLHFHGGGRCQRRGLRELVP